MSSGNVSSDSLPKEIKWRPIDPPIHVEISLLGKAAVRVQTDIPRLKFDAVQDGWTITPASGYGKIHALIIKATPADGIPREYLAIVLADPAGNFEKLLSFWEYSAAQ